MKKKIVSCIGLILIMSCIGLIMISCLMIGAVAASNNVEISALLSYSTPVKYNGHLQEFKNVNGEIVYPILYQGTTYLPVRAVCEMLGIAVDYDISTGTVYLGERDRVMVTAEMLKSTAFVGLQWTTDSNVLNINGKNYSCGFKTEKTNNFADYPIINLEKKYTTLSFYVYNDSDTQELSMEWKNVDEGNTIKNIKVAPREFQLVELPVSGVNRIGFHIGTPTDYIASTQMKAIIVDMGLN